MGKSRKNQENFVWKDAAYRIACRRPALVRQAIVRLRGELEAYLGKDPAFARSLEPVSLQPGAPEIVRRMHAAALRTGVGPMAAVAGAIAQMAAEAGRRAGAGAAIAINNGGDIFLLGNRTFYVGIHPGADHPLAGRLVMAVPPERLPLAVCSSSGRLGHSYSRGACDLAVVLAPDAALADAAATLAANRVRTVADIPAALERTAGVPGVEAVLVIHGERVGMRGRFPPFVRKVRCDFETGIVRHPESGAPGSSRRGTGRSGESRLTNS